GQNREAVVAEPADQVARADRPEQTRLGGCDDHVGGAVQLHQHDRAILAMGERTLGGGAEPRRVNNSLSPRGGWGGFCFHATSLSGAHPAPRRRYPTRGRGASRAEKPSGTASACCGRGG